MLNVSIIGRILRGRENEALAVYGIEIGDTLNEVREYAVQKGVEYVEYAEAGVNDPAAFLAACHIARMLGIDGAELQMAVDQRVKANREEPQDA